MGVAMQTATHTEELIVCTKPQALEEAESVFGSYDTKFQTLAIGKGPVLGKGQVAVVFSSRAEEDSSIEKTLAALRNGAAALPSFDR